MDRQEKLWKKPWKTSSPCCVPSTLSLWLIQVTCTGIENPFWNEWVLKGSTETIYYIDHNTWCNLYGRTFSKPNSDVTHQTHAHRQRSTVFQMRSPAQTSVSIRKKWRHLQRYSLIPRIAVLKKFHGTLGKNRRIYRALPSSKSEYWKHAWCCTVGVASTVQKSLF